MHIDIILTDDKGKKYQGSTELTPIRLKESGGNYKEILSKKQIPELVVKQIIKHLKELKAPSLVVIILKFYGNLPKSKQLEIFKKLGSGTSTFHGGNYTRDIIEKGLVIEVDKIGKESIYGLTEKGKELASDTLKKLETGTFGKK